MLRSLSVVSVAVVFAAAASAQCFNPTGGTSITGSLIQFTGADPIHDEGRSPVTAMGISFPMAGATGTPYTECVIETNGVIYLTNGGLSPAMPANYNYGSLANLRGAAGQAPRIAPYWRDIWAMPSGWDITTVSVPGVSFQVNWINTTNFGATSTFKSFSAKLYATGLVEYSYDNLVVESSAFVGLSIGNAVGTSTTPASNLAGNPVGGTLGLIWEQFTAANWDLSNKTLSFVPNALGGYDVLTTCNQGPAAHSAYGAGCYTVPGTGAYQLFADAALASTGLQGNAILIAKTGTGYTSVWMPGAAAAQYVAPTAGAVAVPASDDGDFLYTSALPISTPAGPRSTIRISSNGILTLADTANQASDWTPTGAEFANAANPAFYCWHDWNPTEAGSGLIKTEQIGTTLYITWDGVESYSNPTAANPGTMQWQINLLTGDVMGVFLTIDSNTTSTFGSGYLVGFRGQFAVTDNGSEDLTQPKSVTYGFAPVALSATPTPVLGTTFTYTTRNAPEIVPGSGLYVALFIQSLGQNPAGVDLGFIGAPGCSVYVNTLDVTTSLIGPSPLITSTFTVPLTAPIGVSIYAQTAVLITPGTVGGQNPGGFVTSNGLTSFINAF